MRPLRVGRVRDQAAMPRCSSPQRTPSMIDKSLLQATIHARPLVVRFGSMGDMVILLTLIRALHERFGQPVDVVSSHRWTRPLLESQPGVGTLYLIRSRKMPYALSTGQWRLVAELRRRGAGPTWMCKSDEKSRQLVARAGIPLPLIVDQRQCPILPGEHFVDRWARFAQMTPSALQGIADANPEDAHRRSQHVPPLVVAPAWRTELQAWLMQRRLADRPLVLIQAGNKRTMRFGPRRRARNTKYWPETCWAQLIVALTEIEPDAAILLLGVRRESRLNEDILKLARTTRAHNIAGDLPIPRLLALQERAVGMISVDTGPAHSAGALGCPLVVLFGTAEPARYRPRSPTGAVEVLCGTVDGRPSMLGIHPEEVLAAWHTVRRLDAGRCREHQ